MNRIKGFIRITAIIMGMALMLTACKKESDTLTAPNPKLPSAQESGTGKNGKGGKKSGDEVSLKITTETKSFCGNFNGQEEIIMNLTCDSVYLEKGSEKAAKVLEANNKEVAEYLEEKALDAFQMSSGRYYLELEAGYDVLEEISYTANVRRADSSFISILFSDSGHLLSEGTRPYTWYQKLNINAQTGEEVRFSDVVSDTEAFVKAAMEAIAATGESGDNLKIDSYSQTLEEDTLEMLEGGYLAWVLTQDGIELWYGDYQLGSSISGTFDVLIPYKDHKELMNTEYFEDVDPYDVQSRVSADAKSEDVDLSDFCLDKGSFMIHDFRNMAGIYQDENGVELKIDESGMYTYAESYGYLLANPGSLKMIEDVYSEETGDYEKQEFGNLTPVDDTTMQGSFHEGENHMFTLITKYGNLNGIDTQGEYDVEIVTGMLEEAPYEEVVLDDGESALSLWLYANNTVKDFEMFNVSLLDYTDAGAVYDLAEPRYSKKMLSEGALLLTTISIPGDTPYYGFSYTDSEGEKRYFAIWESGYDGSLSLEEFYP